jgi:hypothetical protein
MANGENKTISGNRSSRGIQPYKIYIPKMAKKNPNGTT